jgi:ribosomal protein S27AE
MSAIPRPYVSSETSTRKRGRHKTECSRCGLSLEKHRIGKQCYCLACHAEYMRINRPKHSELKPEAKKKANARAYAHVYRDRGLIEKKPCENCGNENSQMHHDDHNKPTDVRWFCRPCHLGWHRVQDGKQVSL